MYCKKCGAELKNEAVRFCNRCGEPVAKKLTTNQSVESVAVETSPDTKQNMDEKTVKGEVVAEAVKQEVPEEKEIVTKQEAPAKTQTVISEMKTPEKPKKKKTGMFIGIAAVLLVVVIGGIVLLLNRSGKSSATITAWYDENKGKVRVVIGQDYFYLPAEADDDTSIVVYTKAKSPRALVWVSDDYDLGEMYYISGKDEYSKVGDDLRMATYSPAISNDGKKFSFINSDKELMYYDGDYTKIENDVERFTLSPNGEVVAYIADEKGYVWKNGEKTLCIKEKDYDRDNYICSVSDDGKKMFAYMDNTGNLAEYTIDGDEVDVNKKILSDVSWTVSNLAGNELYVGTDKGLYVYDVKTETPVKLTNDKQAYWIVGGEYRYIFAGEYVGLQIDTCKDMIVESEDNIYYIDKDFETTKIASGVSSTKRSEDGNVVVYRKKNKLYKYDLRKEEETSVASNVSKDANLNCFAMNASGSEVYYCNDDNDLVKVIGDEETKIKSDVMLNNIMFYKGKMYFVDYIGGSEYELYCIEKDKAVKVSSDVQNVFINVRMGALCYFTNDDEGYANYNGKEFVKYY